MPGTRSSALVMSSLSARRALTPALATGAYCFWSNSWAFADHGISSQSRHIACGELMSAEMFTEVLTKVRTTKHKQALDMMEQYAATDKKES